MNRDAARWREEPEFDLLVEIIGVLQRADAQPGLSARVQIENCDDGGIHICAIEARIDGQSYVSEHLGRQWQRRISYRPDTRSALIEIHGEAAIERENEWRIPVVAPELAMFRPLDLPMWGRGR